MLLNDIYRTIPDPGAQDRFFSDAAAEVFDLFNAGTGNVTGTIRALDTAVGQGRLMLWSSRQREQAVLAGTRISGELRGTQDGSPVVGLYLHDRTPGKMGYYQRVRARVQPACSKDGSGGLQLTVKISSAAPKNAASLPDALTGGGQAVPRGKVRTEVYVYAPEGAVITGTSRDPGRTLVKSRVDSGLSVASHTLTLAPDQSASLKYDMSAPSAGGQVKVRVTPGATDKQFSGRSAECGVP